MAGGGCRANKRMEQQSTGEEESGVTKIKKRSSGGKRGANKVPLFVRTASKKNEKKKKTGLSTGSQQTLNLLQSLVSSQQKK